MCEGEIEVVLLSKSLFTGGTEDGSCSHLIHRLIDEMNGTLSNVFDAILIRQLANGLMQRTTIDTVGRVCEGWRKGNDTTCLIR